MPCVGEPIFRQARVPTRDELQGLLDKSIARLLKLFKAIISNETSTALLLMAVASTMLSVPVVSPMLAALRGLFDKRG